MSNILEILGSIFKKPDLEPVLDDRFEFRLNKKEKVLIKKYCELKKISASEFFRKLAMREIDRFINLNN